MRLVPHREVGLDDDGVGSRALRVEHPPEMEERQLRASRGRRSHSSSPRARPRPATPPRERSVHPRPRRRTRCRRPRRSPGSACSRDGIVVGGAQTGSHRRSSTHSMRLRRHRPRAIAARRCGDRRCARRARDAAATTGSSERRARTSSAASAGTTSCSAGAAPTSSRAAPGGTRTTPGPGTTSSRASYDGARDVVRCGPGLDVVNADLVDAVARDCELVGRRLSRDPYTTDGAQHETRGRARQLHVRSHDGRHLPGRDDASTARRRTSAAR